MPNAIQVIATLEYLGKYASGSYFGLILQVGTGDVPIATQSTQVSDALANLLKPWHWKSPISNTGGTQPWWPRVQLWMYPTAGSPNTATASVDDPVPVDISAYDCPLVRKQLEDRWSTAVANSNLSWADPGADPKNIVSAKKGLYPWPAQLSQVTRLAYPIPHILRLSYIMKVNDPQFAQPVAASSYFATIAFTTNIANADKTYTPQTSGAAIQNQNDGTNRITIPYDDPSLFLITQPLTRPTPITTVLGTLTPEVKDWQAHLVAGCADVFDLASRLLAPLRSDCKDAPTITCSALQLMVAAEFNSFIAAFLTAQRNLVSYGVLTGPDGSSLLGRLCDQWASQVNDPASSQFAIAFLQAVRTQLQSDQTNADKNSTHDAWLRVLAKSTPLSTSSLIGPAPTSDAAYSATTKYSVGQTVLYHAQLYVALNAGTLTVPSNTSADWKLLKLPWSVSSVSLPARLVDLEHLQQSLSQNDVLSSLLLTVWDNVQQGAGLDATLYRSFRSSASSTLLTLNVRGLLLQGNLQDSWKAVVSGATRDKLRTNIPAQLKARMSSLLGVLPGTAMSQALQDGLASATASWASNTDSLDTLIPLSLTTSTAQRTRTSEGLSVLLGSLDALDGAAQDAADDLRQMAGLCVLMREQTENVWRCLNVGKPVCGSGEDNDPLVPAIDNLATPVIVPLPQHAQDGLRRATLTYNNQPLMSESPAHRFGRGVVPVQPNAGTRVVTYRHPAADGKLESTGEQRWKLPGLAFNRKYDILVGRVSNSGALPPSFADPVLGPGVLSFDTINASALSPSLAGVPYLRSVPVSGLGFGGAGTDFSKLALPPIPTDVLPRARDTASRADETTPLVMLAPYGVSGTTSSFSLSISKPTVDLLTWDRWMAAQDASYAASPIRALRSQVWRRYNILARREKSTISLSLDDPAVRRLKIVITGIDGIDVASGTDTKSWSEPMTSVWNVPDPGPLSGATAPPSDVFVLPPATAIALKITVMENIAANTFDKSTWTLTVKPGTLGTISLTPVVDAGDQKLFASCIDPKNLKACTFLVETANQYLFGTPQPLPGQTDADLLRRAIAIQAPDGIARKSVDVTFNLAGPSFVGNVDLQTQQWRWDGRILKPYPYGKAHMPPTREILEWELDTFSTRIASDATTRPMLRSNPKDSSNQPSPGIAFGAHDDRSADPGATYYRAGIIAYNRYGSMIPEAARSVKTLTEFASVPGADGGWVRCFVPATLPATYVVPKPAIKFIVPLTGSADASQPSEHAASVLVLVQGPWYALGGLAEEMRVSIATADPSLDANAAFQEAGADPIVYSGKRGDLPSHYRGYDAPTNLLHGPVGHTFDTSDANPLWVYSSFVLDAPVVDQPKSSAAQEGTFAAVKFKRVLRAEGLANGVPNLTSAETSPVWVQFLPSRFLPFNGSVDALQLNVGADGSASIQRNQETITLSHGLNNNSKTEHIIFALLLTEQVPDLLGRKGQERFRAVLLQPASAGSALATWTGVPEQGPNYLGRIMVIQRQVSTYSNRNVAELPLSSADLLWTEMFPPDDTMDASSRILAVSPPIPLTVQDSCLIDTGGQK